MHAYLKRTPVSLSMKNVLRITGILAILLVGLLGLGSQQVQADAPSCDPASFCTASEQDLPDPFDPQLVVFQTTHAYTGPGYNYLSYGNLTMGYTTQVTGISEDGKWLVIPFPRSIAPDGQAWVNTGDVSQKNIRVIPDWLVHCDGSPMTYCGYILAQTALSDQVLPDWLVHCDRNSMTYCAYILANSPRYIPVKNPSAQVVKFSSQ